MRGFGLGSQAISAGVTIALVAGCGGSQSLIGVPGTAQLSVRQPSSFPVASDDTSFSQYKTSGPLLYVTNDGEAHNVTVYRAGAKDPSPIATISDDLEFPAGVCVDGQGTLYVADQYGWIAEYPAGKTRPSKMITKGTDNPGYCAIDSQGNLWVTNVYGPDVTEYLRGSTKPHTVITKGLTYPVGLAIDQSGNIYVGNGGYNGFGPYSILVYASGTKSPSRTITDGVTAPNGIAADKQDTLYVANHIANNVEKYRSGQNHPYQTITDGLNRPSGITVDKEGWLYVVNFGYTGEFDVAEYPPGSTKPSSRQVSKGLYEPFDVGYSPALLP